MMLLSNPQLWDEEVDSLSEPKAVWSTRKVTTDKSISLTQNIILSYARDALHTLVRRINWVHEHTRLREGDSAALHEDLASVLSDIVFHQGIASVILFSIGPRRHQESNEAFRSRRERTTYVEQRCQGLTLTALKSRTIRNALTHLDEYLADELSAPETGWFIDVALREAEGWGNPNITHVKFCRSYLIATDTLMHFKDAINLSQLKDEAEQALTAIWRPDDTGYYSGPLHDGMIAPKDGDDQI